VQLTNTHTHTNIHIIASNNTEEKQNRKDIHLFLMNKINTKKYIFLYRAPFDNKTHTHQSLINRYNIQK
jgi:hypothetical protein